jgi:hypothetical protein
MPMNRFQRVHRDISGYAIRFNLTFLPGGDQQFIEIIRKMNHKAVEVAIPPTIRENV